jgi:AraC-like DNA-binding protein
MLMIPVTFLPAVGLLGLAIWLKVRFAKTLDAPWMIAFLSALAIQLILLGTRYGYGVGTILAVQHITGAFIPPLGYLAFTNPAFSKSNLTHAIPIFCMGLIVLYVVPLADVVLSLITLGYALALTLITLKGEGDVFSWAPLRYEPTLRSALWATVAALVLSGVTDALIALDFFFDGGGRTTSIVATASIGGLVLLGVSGFLLSRGKTDGQHPAVSKTDQALVEKLCIEFEERELFRDPDLRLNRIAKRLGLPAKQISQAVNKSTGLNMSQFVNNMRISAVCKMLKASDMSITTAMLEAGFYTKSNFNREFRRVTGQTPTEWRNAQKMGDEGMS